MNRCASIGCNTLSWRLPKRIPSEDCFDHDLGQPLEPHTGSLAEVNNLPITALQAAAAANDGAVRLYLVCLIVGGR